MIPTTFTDFSQNFSGSSLICLLVISGLNAALLFMASLKFMLALQQGGYRYDRYFKWLSSPETPYLSRLMLLCLLGFLFFNVLNVSFMPIIGDNSITSYVGFVSYLLFTLLYINTESGVNAKVPLKKTKRLVRLSITYIITLFACTFGLATLLNHLAYRIGNEVVAVARFSFICAMPILSPFILFIAYCINEPFEGFVRWRYVKIAKAKLDKHDVIRVGITGSFGKTSVKEILRTILSQKFRVLSTAESYNTPLGIALTVKNLDSTYDVFLAEMGARRKGDIMELAQMVKPTLGVLTGINNQHLESFKTIENIKDTKYELFDYMGDEKAGFFSADNEGSKELWAKFGGEKYLAGAYDEQNFVYASDVLITERGTTFNLNIKGEESVKCSTVLLGKHSVSNICLASAVAYKLGLTPTEIAEGISRIKSINHRLEIIPNSKGIVLIDDSYNSNEDGARAGLDVLDNFKGRKIVLTPGLVELGKRENVANFEFGKILAKRVDKVIIVGKHNAEMILSGLLEGGMSRENIYFEKTITRGNKTLNEILTEGDVVLFENDLPDNYN